MVSRTIIILFLLTLLSCKKDTAPATPQKIVCGTEGWPQGNWKVKCVVTGANKPDSVSFDINGGHTNNGTYYFKRFLNPNLPLSDSTNFCGDLNSDINVRIYSLDTTKIFTCSIYTNSNLITQKTGHTVPNSTNSFYVGGQCK